MSEDPQILRLTSHFLDWYQACPLSFDRQVNMMLAPASTPEYFSRGSYIGLLLELYYKNKLNGVSFLDNLSDVESKATILTPDTLSIELAARCREVFNEYAHNYRDEKFKPIEVEKQVSTILYQDDKLIILYEGRPDVYGDNDGPICMDHKSEEKKTYPLGLSNQFMGYCYLKKTDKIIRNAVGFQKTVKPIEKFHRDHYSYTKSQLKWWLNNTLDTCKDILESYQLNRWPARFTSCELYGGNYGKCMFAEVCSQDTDDWTRKLNDDYIKRESLYT